MTERQKQQRRQAQARYSASPKGKATRKAWRTSPYGRFAEAARRKAYTKKLLAP